jgi:predicted permease
MQRRAAGATALIVLTLALALGANTATLSVADALLFRAVPYPHPGRLLVVTTAFPAIRLTGMGLSGPEALELRELTQVFAAIGPYAFAGLTVQGASGSEQAPAVEVSQGAADALQLTPAVGRPFTAGEYLRNGAPVALLSDELWARAFGRDASVVGRVVAIGGVSRQVVGIAPKGTTLLNRPVDVWIPLRISRGDAGGRADHRFNVVGRLADGRSGADAAADLDRAMTIWREETGEFHAPSLKMHPLQVESLSRATTGLNREPIAALAGAVVFVLLIACANIANLLVARADQRRADLAIQLALGATRGRLLADSLAEGLTLAVAGGLSGLLVSRLIVDLLKAMWPIAANAELALDYRVLATAAAVTIAVGCLIGIAPAARLNPRLAADWLKTGTRGNVGGPGRMHLQTMLIASQLALAVLLSASAGLMVRSLLALTSIDTGVDARGVVRAFIAPPAGGYTADGQVWSFYDQLLERAHALPGVRHAAVMSGLPPLRGANNTTFLLDGNELVDHSSIHQVEFLQYVSPGYLATLGIPVRQGRELASSDDERAAPVAMVNETLARQFWPGTSAIGRRLRPAGEGPWFTVVGVVADVRQAGVKAPAGSEVYIAHRQGRLLFSTYLPRSMNLVISTSADPSTIARPLREEVNRLDPTVAISDIEPLQTAIDRTMAQPRLLAWTFGAFALLALVVAGVGVYAVTAHAVGARTPEFGVRMALGAHPNDIVRLVLTGSILSIAIGVAAGTAGAIGTARLLENLIFGVPPLDPASIAVAALVLSGTALVAAFVPAVRAARIDPLTALRES